MSRNLRTAVLISAIAIGSAALSVSAAGAATVPGCTNPADSALNQYCEVIPTSTGGQTPNGGSPRIGATLLSGLLNRISHESGPQARVARTLLTLPAATHQVLASVPTQRTHGPTAGASLPPWLYVALAALALALLGSALIDRRRHLQQNSPPPADAAA